MKLFFDEDAIYEIGQTFTARARFEDKIQFLFVEGSDVRGDWDTNFLQLGVEDPIKAIAEIRAAIVEGRNYAFIGKRRPI